MNNFLDLQYIKKMDNIVLFIIYSCTFLLFIILRFKLKRGQLKTLTLWLENIPLTKNSQVYIKNSNNKKNIFTIPHKTRGR